MPYSGISPTPAPYTINVLPRRQAYTFRLWLLVRINQFISFTENAHCLFKFRVQTRHILNGKTIFKPPQCRIRPNNCTPQDCLQDSFLQYPRYTSRDCTQFCCSRYCRLNVCVHKLRVCRYIVVKFFVSLLFKRMFPNQLSKQYLVYTVL
mgnify:CR=1 FL=1